MKMESEECVSAIREKLQPLEGMHTFLYLETILDYFFHISSLLLLGNLIYVVTSS